MPKINILPAHEAHKVAAGEVVERPAHILKELIENSIDADASHVTVYIKQGGKELIRVVDDGIGMDAVDAHLCFEKHATSKIKQFDDLVSVGTFGFRGEALASVAAVARVVLRTKERTALTGIELEVSQNVVQKEREVSINAGTDISVCDLFYQIPARKKFLKSDQSEWRAIQQLLQAFCLDYPAVGFTVFVDEKQLMHCVPTDSLLVRWQQLFKQSGSSMLPLVESVQGSFKVTGLISNHQEYSYDRSQLFFFVNNRWVKNQPFYKALLNGYAQVLPEGRFARGVVAITCDVQEVDINIHPRKEEVKFMHPQIIERSITAAVKKTLESHISSAMDSFSLQKNLGHQEPVFWPTGPSPVYTFGAPNYGSNTPNTSIKTTFDEFPSSQFIGARVAPRFEQNSCSVVPAIHEPLPPAFELLSLWRASGDQADVEKNEIEAIVPQRYAIIGQYHKTYILIEKEEGLFLVDQHAAHERILYEQFASRFGDVPTIPLVAPIIISLTNQDRDVLLPHLSLFAKQGVVLDLFGQNELMVQALPVHARHHAIEELVREVIAWLHETSGDVPDEFMHSLHEKMRAQMACKAAVKAGDALSHDQMQKILADLDTVENRFTCPHGRPTGLLFSLHEIEKKFKRRK